MPIVLFAGRDDEADRVMGLWLCADDHITQPFRSRELLARVRAVLGHYRTCRKPVNARGLSRTDAPASCCCGSLLLLSTHLAAWRLRSWDADRTRRLARVVNGDFLEALTALVAVGLTMVYALW